MRRALLIGGLLACAVTVGPPAAVATVGPQLAETAGSPFPDRSWVLTLPRPHDLDATEITVRENGRRVEPVAVARESRAVRVRPPVVLVVDTSGSVRGRSLISATNAARAFVRRRSGRQPVAVVSFAGAPRIEQSFTTDTAALERAAAAITPEGGGTRVFDAVATAVRLLEHSGHSSGAVVVLSDGGDRGSRISRPQVAALARAAHARVIGVGLPTGSSDFGTLNLLGAETGGEFSPVTSVADLTRVYERLGASLPTRYVLRYRSAARPTTRVEVGVAVRGLPGLAETSYVSPPLVKPQPTPLHRSPTAGLWTSSLLVVAVGMLVAGLLAAALWLVLRPRGDSLQSRLTDFVSLARDKAVGASPLTARTRDAVQRSLGRARWWAAFREQLDIARIGLSAERLAAWVAVATLTLIVLLPLIAGSPAFAPLALAVPATTWLVIQNRVAAQRRMFIEQLSDNLQVIASAMRAGHSFVGALSVVVDDAPEPTRRELQRVIADERLGVPLERALDVVVRRMASKDLEQVALVASLQRETGGNTAEVLDRVTETIRQRHELRRMVKTLTAQGRMSRWVLSGLPAVLLVLINAVNPEYMQPLFHTPTGRLLLALATAMVCTGSYVIKRIVDIKV